MSFTSPPNLTKPDTSADIIRPRKLGTVNCINIARLGEPVTLRYFGASALYAATGQAHPTQGQAEADVIAWADGKHVGYEQQAVVPLSCQARCTKKFALPADAALANRLPDAFTNAIGLLEHLGREGVAEHLQTVATTMLTELRKADVQIATLTQQLTPGSPTERAPTQWAYEQACAALEKHRQRADAAEACVPRWIPVAEWEKVNHVEVRVLWVFNKGWNLSEVYWDAIGQFWRRESTGDRFEREVLFVIAAPGLPAFPALPQPA